MKVSAESAAFLAGVGATLPAELRERPYAHMTTAERNAVVRHYAGAGVSPFVWPAAFAQWQQSGLGSR